MSYFRKDFTRVFIISVASLFFSVPTFAGILTMQNFIPRVAHIYTPACATAASPALIVLHPGISNALLFRGILGIEETADAMCMKVAYMDGTPILGFPNTKTWNSGTCCGAATPDDVAFFESVASYLSAPKTYVMGFSNGAMMAYRIVCERPDLIDGAFMMAGTIDVPLSSCQASIDIPVVHVHGLSDTNIPFGGGPGPEGMTVMPFSALRADFIGRGARFTIFDLDGTAHAFADQQASLSTQYGQSIQKIIQDTGK